MIYRTMTAEEQNDTELVFAQPGRRSRRLQPHRVAIPDIDLLAGLQPNWQSRPERGHRAGNLVEPPLADSIGRVVAHRGEEGRIAPIRLSQENLEALATSWSAICVANENYANPSILNHNGTYARD